MVHIIIDEGIHKRLSFFKVEEECTSFNEAVKKLLDNNSEKNNESDN